MCFAPNHGTHTLAYKKERKNERKKETTALGLSIRLSMFELRETGDWDIFLGPPERARAETGGADQWVLKRRECLEFARVNKATSAFLGYPLSVFNKNSTLKECALGRM